MNDQKLPHLTALTVEIGYDGRFTVSAPTEEFLNNIKEKGSLALAARTIGFSYTYLWTFLKDMEKNIGEPIINTKRGGKTGGCTTLTVKGEAILKKLQYLRETLNKTLHEIILDESVEKDLVIIGSQCVGLDLLIQLMKNTNKDLNISISHVGSMKGLEAIAEGYADIAGVHLLDEDTGEYNSPSIKRLNLHDKVIFVNGYLRRQCLMVKKGNPKGIQSLRDLLLGDLLFINRNKGSGTRLLLDNQLKRLSTQRGLDFENIVRKIKGYNTEALSSIEVAEAVSQGRADIGLGIEAAAKIYNLDIIPISEEHYDFVIRKDRLEKKAVKLFLNTLKSEKFRRLLTTEAQGLIPTNNTGKDSILSDISDLIR